MRTRSFRFAAPAVRALLTAAVALVASAGTAAAQTFSVDYAAACGPGTGCGLLRFTITAGSDALFLETITFGSPANYTFVPVGGSGIFYAGDDLGEYSGASTVGGAGESVFIDFTEAGMFPPFTLGAGATGWLELDVAESEAPAPFLFTYLGTLEGGGTITGTVTGAVSTVPEPGTVVLLATGLAGLGLVARRRVKQ